MAAAFDHVKDSGVRQEFPTGSRRDTDENKGRPDLIPTEFLRELALHFEHGARKYGDNNWQKGQPLSRYYASAFRHLLKVKDGVEDENHAIAAVWNLLAIRWTLEECRAGRLPRELVDLPFFVQRDTLPALQDLTQEAGRPAFNIPCHPCPFCKSGNETHRQWCEHAPAVPEKT